MVVTLVSVQRVWNPFFGSHLLTKAGYQWTLIPILSQFWLHVNKPSGTYPFPCSVKAQTTFNVKCQESLGMASSQRPGICLREGMLMNLGWSQVRRRIKWPIQWKISLGQLKSTYKGLRSNMLASLFGAPIWWPWKSVWDKRQLMKSTFLAYLQTYEDDIFTLLWYLKIEIR